MDDGENPFPEGDGFEDEDNHQETLSADEAPYQQEEEQDVSDHETRYVVEPQPSSSGSGQARPSDTGTRKTTSLFSTESKGATMKTSTDELASLYKRINRYQPLQIDIDTKLKPFIPDYMPAVGDIDAFIKIPRPDLQLDELGLTVLDEPTTLQSDPSILGLQLRAISKAPTSAAVQVRQLSAEKVTKSPKLVEDWIKSVKELHQAKPPDQVRYTRRMPDIEALMQEWPSQIEAFLKMATLPSAMLDVSLQEYIRIVCALLDVPIYDTKEPKSPQKKSSTTKSNAMIEALHAVFTLFSEFKASGHFNQMDEPLQ